MLEEDKVSMFKSLFSVRCLNDRHLLNDCFLFFTFIESLAAVVSEHCACYSRFQSAVEIIEAWFKIAGLQSCVARVELFPIKVH